MRGGAFFGKRSSTASQLSVTRVHAAWLPTGLASSEPITANPFWVRTSVMAKVEGAQAQVHIGESRERTERAHLFLRCGRGPVALQQRVVVAWPQEL